MPPTQIPQTRSIFALATLYIARMLGLFMVLPVLSLAGEDYLGSSVFLLGVALGIYGLTQACLQIPFGLLSDRFGRKPLIALGLVLFAAGSAVAASAQTIEGLIIGRALQGAGAIAGVVMAMVGDLTSDENRTKAMAVIGISIGVAFAASLVIGPAVSTMGGVRWIFWLTLILAIVGILILYTLVPTPDKNHQLNTVSFSGALKEVLGDFNLVKINLGIFVLHLVLMSLFVVLPLLLESVAVARNYHSWVYLGVMLVAFLLMVPLIIVGEKKKKLKLIFLSVIPLASFALLLLAVFAQQFAVILFAMLLFFTTFNYLEATLPSLMSKTVPTHVRGAGSGVFSTCHFLGSALGGIWGGWLFTHWGIEAVFINGALLFMLWWWFALGMSVPQRSASEENVVA